jgi:hypothetical protein
MAKQGNIVFNRDIKSLSAASTADRITTPERMQVGPRSARHSAGRAVRQTSETKPNSEQSGIESARALETGSQRRLLPEILA